MSVKVSSWVWHGKETEHLAGNELVLMHALADVADDNGRCRFVSEDEGLTYAALGKKARVSKSTVIRLVARLSRRLFVVVERGVKGRPNEFRVLVPWVEKSGSNLTPNGVSGESDSVSTGEDSVSSDPIFGVTTESHSSYRRVRSTDVSTSRIETQGQRFAQPLCEVLVGELRRNEVKYPNPMSKRWLDAARLMVDVDGRDPHLAKALIEWACRDGFWRANILSMPTFREQFDKLRLARERDGGKQSTIDHAREADELLRARHGQQLAVSA